MDYNQEKCELQMLCTYLRLVETLENIRHIFWRVKDIPPIGDIKGREPSRVFGWFKVRETQVVVFLLQCAFVNQLISFQFRAFGRLREVFELAIKTPRCSLN